MNSFNLYNNPQAKYYYFPHFVDGDLAFADCLTRKAVCLYQRRSLSSSVWLAHNMSSYSTNGLNKAGPGISNST